MTSSKDSAFVTKNTGKSPLEDGRVFLGQSTQNIMSYSGADFTTLIYIPIASGYNAHQVTIDEIEDEILELEYIKQNYQTSLNNLYALNNTNQRSINDLSNRINSIESNIQELRRIQNKLRDNKSKLVPVKLDSLQTLSVQMHVDKQPVRALGHSYPKGYTVGSTLVAGSMIFTIIREHPLVKIIDRLNAGNEFTSILPNLADKTPAKGYDMFPTSATAAHLPPLHISILGVNEAGNAVNMTLFGVEFLNDGTVLSIQDLITENTINFVAQDIDLFRTLDTRGVLKLPAISRAVTVSSFLTGPVAAARRARRGLPF